MTQSNNTASGAADLLSLIDSYAEARHVGGCHTYNARTAAARNAVVAALASAAAPPHQGVQWQCGPQASGFTVPQADSQPAPTITDEAIDRIAESMSGGLDGFLKGWGWRQFARAVIDADRAPRGQAPACQHRIVDARNPIIKSGYVCLDCGALFAAGDHDAAPGTQPAQQPVAPTEKYDDTLLPFLALMRKELHANADKGDRPGWLKMSADQALLEIYWHTAKLSAAVKNGDEPTIVEHSADVANMAMMLLDVCGGIPTPQAADSVLEDAARWQEHVGKLDALVAYCPTCCQGFIAQKEMTRDQIIFECGKTAGRAARKEGGK